MKQTALKRGNSVLRSYTPLRAKVGFKRGNVSSFVKKRLPWSKAPLTDQQKLDRLFSEYIRRIHANWKGEVQCVTCGKISLWNKGMDASHFIPRQHLATRYNTSNVFPCCIECNRYHDGKIPEFTKFLQASFGEKIVEELKKEGNKIVYDFPYKEEIVKIKRQLYLLKKQNNSIAFSS